MENIISWLAQPISTYISKDFVLWVVLAQNILLLVWAINYKARKLPVMQQKN